MTDVSARDTASPLLEVRHLSKRFPAGGFVRPRTIRALEDAGFALRSGRILALVGESGSGKSTTARLIARLIAPTGGEIIYRGRNVLLAEPHRASLDYRRRVQMIFQDPFGSLNAVHTVGHHLERPLWIHKRVRTPQELKARVHELLETVGLTPATEFAAQYPHELSGGQRQRVAIARALAVDPELILADEPISMLDVSIRMGVLNLMERLKEERGIAMLYITHDIASARYIGDQTVVMYAGYMVEGAPSRALTEEPLHPYTQLLLSAVPNPQAGRARQRLEARGEVPSLLDGLRGCPFAPRCPYALSVCWCAMPAAVLAGDRWVRCHLHSQAPS